MRPIRHFSFCPYFCPPSSFHFPLLLSFQRGITIPLVFFKKYHTPRPGSKIFGGRGSLREHNTTNLYTTQSAGGASSMSRRAGKWLFFRGTHLPLPVFLLSCLKGGGRYARLAVDSWVINIVDIQMHSDTYAYHRCVIFSIFVFSFCHVVFP
jgi:hypothetical protein